MTKLGLRASDAPLLQELCGEDRRLLMRLGALLQQDLAVSELVLREIPEAPAIRSLLMKADLPEADQDSFASFAEACHCADLGLSLINEGKHRTIAFADEVNNPLAQPPALEAEVVDLGGVGAILPTLSKEIRQPVEGLLKAQADDQRAAALEQLRYLSPPLSLIGELMPLVLADGAELVRERAISLLMASGVRGMVIDIIRALQQEDDDRLSQLISTLGPLPADQIDLLVAAILAAIGRRRGTHAIIELCTAVAERLAMHPGLARLLELLLPIGSRLSLVGLVRRLQQVNAPAVEQSLRPHLGQNDELDATLVVLLASPQSQRDEVLLQRGMDLLVSSGDAPRDRQPLATALRRLAKDTSLASLLVERGQALTACRDTTPFWLIGDLARHGMINQTEADQLCDICRTILSGKIAQPVVAILEHQVTKLLPASPSYKLKLLGPLGDLAAGYRDRHSRDLVSHAIAGLGTDVLDGLWDIIEEHPHDIVRSMVLDIIADRVLEQGTDIDAAIARLMRLAKSAGDRQEQGRALLAAARLSQNTTHPAADPVARTTEIDQTCRGLGQHAISAWGYLASGAHISEDRRSEILSALLAGVTADLPETNTEAKRDERSEEITYILDERLGVHTDSIPDLLIALGRIGASPHLAEPLRRRLVGELCRQWQQVARWEVIWAPGNVQALASCLGKLAQTPGFASNLRRQIAEALLPRVDQLAIAQVIAHIAKDTEAGPSLADVAERAAKRLIQAVGNGTYADDEQEDLGRVLIDLIQAQTLGEEDDLLRRRLCGLLASIRSQIGPRNMDRLKQLGPNLPEQVRERLAWALD